LLPADGSSARPHRVERMTYALVVLAIILAAAAIYVPIERARRTADDLAQKMASLRQSAIEAAALRKDIDALRKTDQFLLDRRRHLPTVSALLFETTHLLPDDTWLSDWRVSGPEIQLEGVTRSAAALIGLLEDSHAFKETTFLAPVTPDPATGEERFHIAAQIVEGGKP
jgi:general secretion pathway protein L